MSEKLYLGLGTNLGDRRRNLSRAIGLLESRLGAAPLAVSRIVESEAQGFEGPDFLNCAVLFPCSESPLEVLRICKEVEREMGRTDEAPLYDAGGGRIYRSRIIDIDILLYGDVEMNTAELVIPHPRIAQRPFVAGPLSELLKDK